MKKTLVIYGDIQDGDAEKLSSHFDIPLANTADLMWFGPVLYLHIDDKKAAKDFAKRLSESSLRPARTLNLDSALRQYERATYGRAFESSFRRHLQKVATAAKEMFADELEHRVFMAALNFTDLSAPNWNELATLPAHKAAERFLRAAA